MKNHISNLGYEERTEVTAAMRSKSIDRNNPEATQNLTKERLSATEGTQSRAHGGVLNTKKYFALKDLSSCLGLPAPIP